MGGSPQSSSTPARDFEQDWNAFRSALDEGDAAMFDEIVDKMQAQPHAMAMQDPDEDDDFTAMLLSVLIEQQREIAELRMEVTGGRR
jgi:hypothetical protein